MRVGFQRAWIIAMRRGVPSRVGAGPMPFRVVILGGGGVELGVEVWVGGWIDWGCGSLVWWCVVVMWVLWLDGWEV